MLKKIVLVIVALLGLAAIVPYLLPKPNLNGRIPDRPFADSRFAQIDGVRLHWRERRVDDSPALVVLLHGYGASAFSWRHTLDALQRAGYHAVAPDLPPFGYSERTADGPDWPALVIALAGEIAPDAPLIVVGHSMGAGVGADIAARLPERIERLVMVDGVPSIGRNSGPIGWFLALPPVSKAAEYWAARSLVKRSSVADMMESALGRPPSEEELDGYFQPLTIAGTYPALLKRLSRRRAVEEGWDRVPLDIIWGEKDEWVPLSAAEKLIETLPRRIEPIVVEGAAHNPMDTHPERFNALLLERIRSSGEQ